MSTKSGYELRKDVLAMAKELSMDEFYHIQDLWQQSAVRDDRDRLIETTTPPNFPTTDGILSIAKELYSFVEQK
jgi:hypothetical protein